MFTFISTVVSLVVTVIALMVSVGCGSAEHQKEKSAAVKAKIDEKSRAMDVFFSPKQSPAAEAVDRSGMDEPATVQNEAVSAPNQAVTAQNQAVTATSPAAPIDAPIDAPKGTFYVASVVSWADAVNKTPDGKRLATREEIFALWDSGAFKKVQFSTGGVWTASQKNSLEVWTLNTYDGSLSSSEKTNGLSTVYVDAK